MFPQALAVRKARVLSHRGEARGGGLDDGRRRHVEQVGVSEGALEGLRIDLERRDARRRLGRGQAERVRQGGGWGRG